VPALSPDQLEQQLRSGKIGTLYLLDGPELWLKERVVERITAALVTPESRDFNFDRFDGATSSGSDIASVIMNVPFLGNRRLVLVKNAEDFKSADAHIIGDALARCPDFTCVVFLYQGKADLKGDIGARVAEFGAVVTFWPPYANQLPAWIMKEAKSRGKTITSDAAVDLAANSDDLQSLSNELDKLALFVGPKPVIDADDVDEFQISNNAADTRKLEDALWRRDMPQALMQAHLLSEAGVRPEVMIPVFERVFKKLALGQSLQLKERKSIAEAMAILQIRGITQQRLYQAGMAAYAVGDVETALGKIVQADEDVKTGLLTGKTAVSLLVTGLLLKRSVVTRR
jgi:DNA polymerase III subunit delta